MLHPCVLVDLLVNSQLFMPSLGIQKPLVVHLRQPTGRPLVCNKEWRRGGLTATGCGEIAAGGEISSGIVQLKIVGQAS